MFGGDRSHVVSVQHDLPSLHGHTALLFLFCFIDASIGFTSFCISHRCTLVQFWFHFCAEHQLMGAFVYTVVAYVFVGRCGVCQVAD